MLSVVEAFNTLTSLTVSLQSDDNAGFSSPKEIDDGWETIIGFIGEPTHWLPVPPAPEER